MSEDTDQAAYDRAADIAHAAIEGLPALVEAADADPIDAAYALWYTFSHILLENGWTACDLSNDLHEIQMESADEGVVH